MKVILRKQERRGSMNLGKVVATRGVADSAAENPEFAAFVVK